MITQSLRSRNTFLKCSHKLSGPARDREIQNGMRTRIPLFCLHFFFLMGVSFHTRNRIFRYSHDRIHTSTLLPVSVFRTPGRIFRYLHDRIHTSTLSAPASVFHTRSRIFRCSHDRIHTSSQPRLLLRLLPPILLLSEVPGPGTA